MSGIDAERTCSDFLEQPNRLFVVRQIRQQSFCTPGLLQSPSAVKIGGFVPAVAICEPQDKIIIHGQSGAGPNIITAEDMRRLKPQMHVVEI